MRFKLKSIVDVLRSRTFFKEFAEDQGAIQSVARNLEYFLNETHTEKITCIPYENAPIYD
ncbi:MAG: hypothetical protein DLM72_21405 [Candidatus Nitrosopolaris wilkensis]|nr:MAG: hypothetical protein DLM72_21405 [Candidatus Nitrosopolaris wilkensis]